MDNDNLELMHDEQDHVHENCEVINEIEEASPRASFAGPIQDAPGCATMVANTLSQQCIHEVNVILEDATGSHADLLVSFDQLNVNLGSAAYPYLQPPAVAALQRAIEDRGKTLHVNSAYRALAQQFLLYSWWTDGTCDFQAVAKPGASWHQAGLAIDVADYAGWRPYLEKQSWKWFGNGDKPHFTYVGSGRVPSVTVHGKTVDVRNTATLAFQRLWNRNQPSDQIAEDGEYGPTTRSKLMRSPANGFAIAPWDKKPRVLRLCQPMLEGSDVEKIQQALGIGADGMFGNDTKSAVQKFQEAKGLKVDGVVGPNTLKELFPELLKNN
ncbi:peptidoglycan-binding protein [Leptolyngbya sp. AN02str]|uniref:peptidoglycan-binding protein n=1 Tax=Leptolyngbya sp. AN02str TaxID=3423363 RepID=UPI003D316FE9